MTLNGKCCICVPPSTGLNGLLLSVKLNIPEGPEYENTTLYQFDRESLTHTKIAGVKSKFSEKRTYQNSENVHYI